MMIYLRRGRYLGHRLIPCQYHSTEIGLQSVNLDMTRYMGTRVDVASLSGTVAGRSGLEMQSNVVSHPREQDFGWSVSLDGDIVAVGCARGESPCHVYEYDGQQWHPVAGIHDRQNTVYNKVAVSLSGRRLLFGGMHYTLLTPFTNFLQCPSTKTLARTRRKLTCTATVRATGRTTSSQTFSISAPQRPQASAIFPTSSLPTIVSRWQGCPSASAIASPSTSTRSPLPRRTPLKRASSYTR